MKISENRYFETMRVRDNATADELRELALQALLVDPYPDGCHDKCGTIDVDHDEGCDVVPWERISIVGDGIRARLS